MLLEVKPTEYFFLGGGMLPLLCKPVSWFYTLNALILYSTNTGMKETEGAVALLVSAAMVTDKDKHKKTAKTFS